MKLIILISLLLAGLSSKCQTTYDTQAALIPVIKTTTANVFSSPQYWLRGYVILKTTTEPGGRPITNKVGYLWSDRIKKIQAPYIVNERDGEIPINGYDFN